MELSKETVVFIIGIVGAALRVGKYISDRKKIVVDDTTEKLETAQKIKENMVQDKIIRKRFALNKRRFAKLNRRVGSLEDWRKQKEWEDAHK